MDDIDRKVDQLIGGPLPSRRNHKPVFKRTKLLGKLSPLTLGLICVTLAAGMLTGLLFSVFQVNLQGNVVLTGRMEPLFSFDGQEFQTAMLNLSSDITELNSSEIKYCHHYVINEDEGCWGVNVDFGDTSFMNIPEHPWYGLNMSVDNWELNGVPTENNYLFPGDNLSFDLVYSLHHEFVTTDIPFEMNISIILERVTNLPPQCNDTEINLGVGTYIDVSIEDLGFDTDGPLNITFVSCTRVTGDQHITVTIHNGETTGTTYIRVTSTTGFISDSIWTFVITDGDLNGQGTLTVHRV